MNTDSKELWHSVHSQIPKRETKLGQATSNAYHDDPKMIAFIASRYKFVSKMLEGKKLVVEIGCGDAFGLPIVAAAVEQLIATDIHEGTLEDCRRRLPHLQNATFQYFDFRAQPYAKKADAIYCVDVLEHIFPEEEKDFLANIVASLTPTGILIVGTPNVYGGQYASAYSKLAHVNLKDPLALRALMLSKFDNCFCFGMNDEIVHTGYHKMCHYIWCIGVGVKASRS